MLATEWHVGQVFFSLLWLALFVIWLWLLITVFVDVFVSHDLGGPAKALWVLFVVIAPYLGVFVYLVVRGRRLRPIGADLGLRSPASAPAQERMVLSREQVDALTELNADRDHRTITAAEYRTRRAQILS